MRTPLRILLVFVLLGAVAHAASAAKNVSACGVINESSVLTQDVSSGGNCFTLSGNDISLDCRYHRISGAGTGTGIQTSGLRNSMYGCIVSNFSTGLQVSGTIAVTFNKISSNNVGVNVSQNASPSLNGNSITNQVNVYSNSTLETAAQNNWWGTQNASLVAAKLFGNVSYDPFLLVDPYVDEDSDGAYHFADNCPAIANADQNDTDKDGVGNVCDNCATTPNSGQENRDNDSSGMSATLTMTTI